MRSGNISANCSRLRPDEKKNLKAQHLELKISHFVKIRKELKFLALTKSV